MNAQCSGPAASAIGSRVSRCSTFSSTSAFGDVTSVHAKPASILSSSCCRRALSAAAFLAPAHTRKRGLAASRENWRTSSARSLPVTLLSRCRICGTPSSRTSSCKRRAHDGSSAPAKAAAAWLCGAAAPGPDSCCCAAAAGRLGGAAPLADVLAVASWAAATSPFDAPSCSSAFSCACQVASAAPPLSLQAASCCRSGWVTLSSAVWLVSSALRASSRARNTFGGGGGEVVRPGGGGRGR